MCSNESVRDEICASNIKCWTNAQNLTYRFFEINMYSISIRKFGKKVSSRCYDNGVNDNGYSYYR